jgi:hypothetical protein
MNDKLYFGDAISEINDETWLTEMFKWRSGPKPKYVYNNKYLYKSGRHEEIYYPELSDDVFNKYPEIKKLAKETPIFIYNNNWHGSSCDFPSLVELGVNKVISAHDIWILLSEWLANKITENEPIMPIGDDKVRIVSAGFDLKTSFRNCK